MLLLGEHELTLDEKNRMLIPSGIRRILEPQLTKDHPPLVMVIGTNRKIWLYPEPLYTRMVSQAEQEITPDEDVLAFDQLYFAMACTLEWDKQGRVVLPEMALKRTGTGREVTLIGVRNHMELWNRADWEAKHEELLGRMSELSLRARQARQKDAQSSRSQQGS
jgi:MraZ protein